MIFSFLLIHLLFYTAFSFTYEHPTVKLDWSHSSHNDDFRSSQSYGMRPSPANSAHNRGNYQKMYLAHLSSTDFQQQFHGVACESDILNNYQLYAYPHFIVYARTLSCYQEHILSLDAKIKCDKSFRKQTAFVPGFSYSFGIRSEQSGFHDLIHQEARAIIDQQKQQVELKVKGNLHISGQSLHRLKHSCETRMALELEGNVAYRLADRLKAIDEFNNAPGTQIDCQLHKELDESHKTMTQLERTFSNNYYVQTIAPVIYRYIVQAKVERCLLTAFELSDFCYTATQLLSHGMHVLYDASSVVGKGAWKGTKEFVSPDHWRDMATGALQLGLLCVDAVGQEAALDYAIHGALFSNDSGAVTKVAQSYCAHTKAQKDAINESAQQTYQKIQAMSWLELVENGAELGTTMILDTLVLHALSGFTRTASNSFVKQLNSVMENGVLLTEQYAVEVAGFGKLIVEEGAEVATKAADIIKNDLVLFADNSGPVSQKIRYNVPSARQLEDIVYKIRNVGDDILDVMEKAGGHTLEKHVAQTYEDLFLRSVHNAGSTITTFTNKSTAINAVKENLKQNAVEIASWINGNSLADTMVFECSHLHGVGHGIFKGKSNLLCDLQQSRIVLEKNLNYEFGFKILTAFPIVK